MQENNQPCLYAKQCFSYSIQVTEARAGQCGELGKEKGHYHCTCAMDSAGQMQEGGRGGVRRCQHSKQPEVLKLNGVIEKM